MVCIKNGYGIEFPLSVVVNLMDSELYKQIQNEGLSCTPQQFYERYCELHKTKYGEDFVIEQRNTYAKYGECFEIKKQKSQCYGGTVSERRF